jgi:hypothetical protein
MIHKNGFTPFYPACLREFKLEITAHTKPLNGLPD